jgi:hypothetical protein
MTATAPPELHRRTSRARSGKWTAEDNLFESNPWYEWVRISQNARGGPDARTTATPARSVVEAGRLGAKAAQDLGATTSVRTDRLKALIRVRAFARVCRWVAPDVPEPRSPALTEHMLSRHPN